MMKQCRVCNEEKTLDQYSSNAGKADGLSRLCKPCDRVKGRQWYDRNKTKRKATQKLWQEGNLEKVAACSKRYREKNPERVADSKLKRTELDRKYHAERHIKNLEENRKRNREWSKKNPAKHAAICAKRRSSLIKRTVSWASSCAILEIYKKARQLTIETGVPHEVDHIIPLQGKVVSGLHVETNLRVIPMTENRSKSASFVSKHAFNGPAA